MVRPPLRIIRNSALLDDHFQECAFVVEQKESSTATVLPQRTYATCCLTINLAQLTLHDENPKINGSSHLNNGSSTYTNSSSSENSDPPNHNGSNGTDEVSDDESEVLVDSNDNVAVTDGIRMVDEKSGGEPSPKRRRNQSNAE
ncbi:hypothetical protein RB195_026113 [Necator americanus]|uniref:Uncharacterized protein n=1 Tax=Necator americanus TaxID=51031 RepID=A0ABR1EVE0_NECAM